MYLNVLQPRYVFTEDWVVGVKNDIYGTRLKRLETGIENKWLTVLTRNKVLLTENVTTSSCIAGVSLFS